MENVYISYKDKSSENLKRSIDFKKQHSFMLKIYDEL